MTIVDKKKGITHKRRISRIIGKKRKDDMLWRIDGWIVGCLLCENEQSSLTMAGCTSPFSRSGSYRFYRTVAPTLTILALLRPWKRYDTTGSYIICVCLVRSHCEERQSCLSNNTKRKIDFSPNDVCLTTVSSSLSFLNIGII